MLHSILVRRCLLCLFFVLVQSLPACAHNGPPFLLFENKMIGPYKVALWTHPDVGTGTFFVILVPPASETLPGDLSIKIGVQPVSSRLPEVVYAAQRVNLHGQVQYNVQAEFDRQEFWRVRLILQSAQATVETTTQVEVTPPGFGRWDLLFYALPFLIIGLIWSRAIARNHKKSKSSSGGTLGSLAH
jgi:hypothetical protein